MKVYRSNLIIVFVIFLASNLYSQSKFRVGAHVSTLSAFHSGWSIGYVPSIGGSIGVNGDYTLSSKIKINSEILFNKTYFYIKDVVDTREDIDADGNIRYDRFEFFDYLQSDNYIRIPINFNYYFNERFYSSIGFEIDYQISTGGTAYFKDSTISGKLLIKEMRYGVNFGIGWEFKSEKYIFQIEPKYSIVYINEWDKLNTFRVSLIIRRNSIIK